jgi:hypothetical protein
LLLVIETLAAAALFGVVLDIARVPVFNRLKIV